MTIGQRRRASEQRQRASAAARPVHSPSRASAPTTSAIAGHHEQVAGAEHLQRGPPAEAQRVATLAAPQHVVERQQRERQELDVHGLDVRHARQRVGVEGGQAAGEERGVPVAGPPMQHERGRPARQREPDPQRDVVGEHGRAAHPEDRRREQRRHGEVLREGERARLGEEDVGVEQRQRLRDQRVRDPAEDPLVEQTVGAVGARQRRRRRDQRPRVRQRQQHEQA